jgi:hypothetical protein
VGRTSSVLAALLLLILLVYYEVSADLWRQGTWGDVAWLGLVLIPAVFALVAFAVPLQYSRRTVAAGIGFALLAVVLTVAHADVLANFARLGATTFLGFWFLGFFETLGWVVLVAAIIPWVDAYSVWRGPTKTILAHHEHVFSVLSFAFPVPGRHDAANLGLPDLFFFALFLAAAARYGLRFRSTWVCLVASLGVTIALTVWWNVGGLPALPGIALGFLVPNADLLRRRLRPRAPGKGSVEAPGGAAGDR